MCALASGSVVAYIGTSCDWVRRGISVFLNRNGFSTAAAPRTLQFLSTFGSEETKATTASLIPGSIAWNLGATGGVVAVVATAAAAAAAATTTS